MTVYHLEPLTVIWEL